MADLNRRDRIVDFYDSRFREVGPDDPRAVGWASRDDQSMRFDVLLRGVETRGRRVLDVGCGLGHLADHLTTKVGDDFSYTGIDLAPALVEHARQRVGTDRITFEVAEVTDLHDTARFDVGICSGALTLETGDNEAVARATIRRMFELTTETVAVNFMSTHVDWQDPKNHHYDPAQLFTYAKELTPWVALHHDYPLWEFTLHLRHEATR